MDIVDVKPMFNGGDANAFSYWAMSHVVYPAIAKEYGIQGTVYLQFTIDYNGWVRDINVIKGVDEILDVECIRVVSQSPRWTPGQSGGRNVNVTYTFPMIFKLR